MPDDPDRARGVVSLMGLFDPKSTVHDELANQLGATVVRGRKPPALAKHGIVVAFKEHYIDRAYGIRWEATLPLPGVPRFRIYPEGFQSFISKAFGGKDLQIGHNAFDLLFMVKAREPELVKQLWTDAACDLLVGLRDAWIESDVQRIVLRQRVDYDREPDVVAGIQLMFALGAVDLYGRDVLRALPEAQWQAEHGQAWLPGPGSVRIGFVRRDDAVSTAIWASAGTSAEIPDAATETFEKLGAAVERMEPRHGEPYLFVVWGGVQRDPAKLLAAVDAVRALSGAASGDGVFR